MYKNGTLERELYPVAGNGTAGLYDTVTGTFYPCRTTGAAVGNDGEEPAAVYATKIEANSFLEI